MEYKVWIWDEKDGRYHCDYIGPINMCFAFTKTVKVEWIIADDRNKFMCCGNVPERWAQTAYS